MRLSVVRGHPAIRDLMFRIMHMEPIQTKAVAGSRSYLHPVGTGDGCGVERSLLEGQ